ncbi:putative O-methyltransferase YrrM [Ancylobacter sp. 3268]|uniref:O-methyltransferase n=1 Tax=Ancylobacter sp. 3268 TaxID=2817752 RepID=UPI00285A0F21|nr:O-methyltransferase [Ancylobacter sp. 3268]MDR6954678.1 putative O-methyltransferase YrrM [Ancylobacter sp. 3268]
MSQPAWSRVDAWIEQTLLPPDEALAATLEASEDAGLPAINVAPNQGKFLMLLALMRGARRILEIGTLGGYSTIWLARALPAEGRLVTLEFDPHHAEVARANIARAGLADRVEIRVGPARATLAAMIAAGEAPFDLVFIDADKPNNPHYLDAALALSHAGTVIVADNVVRDGRAADPASTDESVAGIRRFMEKVAAEPRLVATAIQTVGSKGHDGFALALVV